MLFSVSKGHISSNRWDCGGGITLVDKSNRKMWESRATSEIFVATEVISQPVALISGSRAQIATRLKLWMESQRSASLKSAKSPPPVLHLAIHAAILCSPGWSDIANLPPTHQSPALMDYCVLGSIQAGAQQGGLKTSVLKSKFLMPENTLT